MKINYVKEVIQDRRVVDSNLYGFRERFIQRSFKNKESWDEIRQQQLGAPM